MKFRTEYEVKPAGRLLGIDMPVAAVGSCFADNITARMRKAGWEAETPLGVLFNPLSIAHCLRLCLLSKDPELEFADSLFESDGITHSWLADSRMSALSRDECIARFRDAKERLKNLLSAGKTLIVTFGTAWCYFLRATGNVVANCHKQPESLFERRLVTVEEIVKIWEALIPQLDCNIIFTVSPVRHIRDGLHGNNLSKATLMLAAEQLCNRQDNCEYFPAFEIINDDLRDYRFYADDLVHPSDKAVEYVWEKFLDTYVSREDCETLRRREAKLRRTAHKPIIKAGG